MAWFYLLLAGAFEMAWPLGFKYTNGFRSNYGVVGLTMAAVLLSFWFMGTAVNRGIHIGTAYAVWTGIGASGTAILGMFLYKEPADAARLTCLAVVILGVVGLKLFSPPQQPSTQTAATDTATDTAPG